jgi:thiamine kinase-like enzyme
MEKLFELTDDEKRIFHSVLSHEDKGETKNYEILKIKKMLEGMSRALDFDEEKVTFFCEELRRAPIIHNDIHIRNIMKDISGNFKMIDFDRCNLEEYVL